MISLQICGCGPCWMTGSCQHGRCLMTAPTDRPSWLSEPRQGKLCATDFPSMSMWVSVHTFHLSFIHSRMGKSHFFVFFLHFFCLQCRTQQITFVLSASHCGLRSTTQKVVPCWMKGGRLLSTNLWVAQKLALYILVVVRIRSTCCSCLPYLSRSHFLKTVVRMMCVQLTWCYRHTWTSLGQGTELRYSGVPSLPFFWSQWVFIVFPPQTKALCDSQPS